MGYLNATLIQVFAHGVDMSLRDVTIAQMENGASKCEWHHALEVCGGFGDFEKVSWLSWVLPRKKMVGFCLLMEALGRCRMRWGRWKSQNRNNVYLSPYVEEPLNSKVIKSFILELRSRKCFSCFKISMFYIYEHSMSISHISIWLWYRRQLSENPEW